MLLAQNMFKSDRFKLMAIEMNGPKTEEDFQFLWAMDRGLIIRD
jgi:hypothetical protein